jgi:chloride channel, nucleotide-sensitive, 1A
MAYEKITSSPKVEDFTALDEHQEQTPGSFFGGKPVLHLQCAGTLRISKTELEGHEDFGLGIKAGDQGYGVEDVDVDVEVDKVDIWVSSRYV